MLALDTTTWLLRAQYTETSLQETVAVRVKGLSQSTMLPPDHNTNLNPELRIWDLALTLKAYQPQP